MGSIPTVASAPKGVSSLGGRYDIPSLTLSAQGISGVYNGRCAGADNGDIVWSFARYLWDIAAVPLASTIEGYINVVVRLFRIQHGIILVKPFALRAWVARMEQVPRSRAFKDPVPKEVIHAVITRKEASMATRTAAMLAYFLCARLGVMVQARVGDFSPAFSLRRKDVRYLPKVGCFEIMLRKGKTNKYNMLDSRFLLPAAEGAVFCPVKFLQSYLEKSRVFDSEENMDLPLLRHEDGRNVTRDHVVALLRRVAAELGIDPTTLGGHSFRISAATHLAGAEVPLEVIQLFGHWATLEGMLRYLRWTGRQAVRVTDALELGSCNGGARSQVALLDSRVIGVTASTLGRTRGLIG